MMLSSLFLAPEVTLMAQKPDIAKASLEIYDPAYKLLGGMPKPEFMLIGAAKCGTTSFSSYLPLHPQVAPCVPKEPNFWSWKLSDRREYQQLFVNTQPLVTPLASQKIGGEYSTSYLLHPLAPRRIRARLPDIKIIVLLRDPVERAYSHYVMARRNGSEPDCSFDEVVHREIQEVPALLDAHKRGFLDTNASTKAHRSGPDGEPLEIAEHRAGWPCFPLLSDRELMRFYVTSYVFRSIYYDQLRRWLQLFPSEQVKIIESARFMANRQEVLGEVVSFLGLQAYEFIGSDVAHAWGGGRNDHNVPGDYEPMASSTRDSLRDYFRPYNEQLFELIGQRFNWG